MRQRLLHVTVFINVFCAIEKTVPFFYLEMQSHIKV